MVINWTKIIILILIIAAFAGIIVGIVLAFRAQCPDGKIFDKTCKKCVTKCPDGRELPTKKNGDRDCDSEICQKICPKDSCRIDSETCGEPCVNKTECCGPGKSCYIGNDTCMENNCGDQFCDLNIPGTQCINGICSNGAVKCDDKDTIKCDNGLCCPSGSVCMENNNTTFCCKPGDVLSNTGCCPKDKVNKTNNDCCQGDQSEWAGICCPKSDQCYDEEEKKEICCPSDTGMSCAPASSTGGKQICKLPCGDRYCNSGEFCDQTRKTCAKDPCEWGDTTYNPPDINEKILCLPNFDQSGALCSEITIPGKHSGILGVWKPDWSYNPGEPDGLENDGLACRTVKIKSNNPKKCNKKEYWESKAAQLYLGDVSFNSSTGILTGDLDCMKKWNTPGSSPQRPTTDNCLESGVCCKPRNNSGTGGRCGTWCLNDDEYCLIADNDQTRQVPPCNGHANGTPEGTGGVSSTDKDWCSKNCGMQNPTTRYKGKFCESTCRTCVTGAVTTGTEGSFQGYTCEGGTWMQPTAINQVSTSSDIRFWGAAGCGAGNNCDIINPNSDDPGTITDTACRCACVDRQQCCDYPNIPQATQPQPSIPSAPLCIGSQTRVQINRNNRKIYTTVGGIKLGDKVKSVSKNGNLVWNTVYYIRDHGFTPEKHLKITFGDNSSIILSENHLIYDQNKKLVTADSLKINDICSSRRVVNIEEKTDIPLTPCCLEGNLFVGDNDILVSCWSNSKENAEKLNNFKPVAQYLLDSLPIEKCSEVSGYCYDSYKEIFRENISPNVSFRSLSSKLENINENDFDKTYLIDLLGEHFL